MLLGFGATVPLFYEHVFVAELARSVIDRRAWVYRDSALETVHQERSRDAAQ